jgi:hypothetical protein
MQILGDIWKDGMFWVIECPTLDVSTQSETKKGALKMMVDLVQTMVNDRKYNVSISAIGKRGFSMTFKNPTPIIAAVVVIFVLISSPSPFCRIIRLLIYRLPRHHSNQHTDKENHRLN